MRNLSIAALVLALAAPGLSRAAGAARGLAHQKSIYADATDTALRFPEGVACDESGAVVVADTGNARLVTYSWKEGVLDGGTQIRMPQLQYPTRVQIDPKGNVYVLERRTRRILKIDVKGEYGGFLEPKGASVSPVVVQAFRVDAAENVHVLDVVAGRVLTVGPDGKVARELPLPKGAAGITDVSVDSTGRLYVVDSVTATVFSADATAKEFTALSKSLKEMISFPTYVAPDNRGRLYVVDMHGNAVVKLGVDGSFQGRELAMGWSDGALYYPGQICVTSAGDVVVADRNNNRVQIFATPR